MRAKEQVRPRPDRLDRAAEGGGALDRLQIRLPPVVDRVGAGGVELHGREATLDAIKRPGSRDIGIGGTSDGSCASASPPSR